jgi:hypothetical protein
LQTTDRELAKRKLKSAIEKVAKVSSSVGQVLPEVRDWHSQSAEQFEMGRLLRI